MTQEYLKTLATLESNENADMDDFRFRFTTGRLYNDYEMMKLMDATTLSEAFTNLNHYMETYRSLGSTDMAELERKGWATDESKETARKMMELL